MHVNIAIWIRFKNCLECRERHLILAKDVGDWARERFMILLKKSFRIATRVVWIFSQLRMTAFLPDSRQLREGSIFNLFPTTTSISYDFLRYFLHVRRGGGVAQSVSARLSEQEVPGSVLGDFNVCFDFPLIRVGVALNTRRVWRMEGWRVHRRLPLIPVS